MNVCLYFVLHRTMLSSVECPAAQHFPHYLINGTIFGKTDVEHKMCVLIFSAKFETFLILRRCCYKCT
jgi:hypothetical protein